jgi:uncharacterized protein (TIGR00725 family)
VVVTVKYLGIAAYSGVPTDKLRENADCLVNIVSPLKDKIYLVLGGYWGLMKYVADKALENGLKIIFTLPSDPPIEPPNNGNTVIIRSDLGFVARSTLLARTRDILVALGGGIGSIIEIAMAYDYGKPVIVVESGMDTDKLPGLLGRYLDYRRKAELTLVKNCGKLEEKLKQLL